MTDRLRTPRERLEAVLAPELVAAVEELVDERVSEALASEGNGSSSPWLSLGESAEYLRVSKRQLQRLLARGKVRSTTIGRRRLLHRADLDNLATREE